MVDWKNEAFIKGILQKLENGIKLDAAEFAAVNTALRKVNGYKQEPYFEVVYHDEYDKTQRRVMNPERHSETVEGGFKVIRDTFRAEFNRLEP